jgi:hypothetical protein
MTRKRTKLNGLQKVTLKNFYSLKEYPSKSDYLLLSLQTNLPKDLVRKWFQNKRFRINRNNYSANKRIKTIMNCDLDNLLDILSS